MPGRARWAPPEATGREMPGSLVACESPPACAKIRRALRCPSLGCDFDTADASYVHKGSKDAIWPDVLAREQIKLFTASPSHRVTVLAKGSHFLNVTHAREVNAILVEMIETYS